MLGFLKENGYVWESGLPGHLTYAPMGKALKNRIENSIRKHFQTQDFVEIESPLILKKDVWINSGHWNKFKDPVIYTQSNKCERADHLIEKHFPGENFASLSVNEIYQMIESINKNILNERDKYIIEIKTRNLMMVTITGGQEAGLRPETATATFNNFIDLLEYHNHTYPIKVFQIGKSFRNEISPRNSLIRGREFTQAEFQIITKNKSTDISHLVQEPFIIQVVIGGETKTANIWDLSIGSSLYHYYLYFTYQLFIDLGIQIDKIRLRQHGEKEKAFYALDAWDIEINLNKLGWTEIAGIHDRGSYDLRNFKIKGEMPHIIEIAIGVDRLFYSILDTLYENKTEKEGKTILKIPYQLAPIQISVLPLVKNKKEIVDMTRHVYQMLRNRFITEYSDKSSVGKRYLRNAERGIPYSIVVDFQSLDDHSVTVRDRDTEEQVRVEINNLVLYLIEKIN